MRKLALYIGLLALAGACADTFFISSLSRDKVIRLDEHGKKSDFAGEFGRPSGIWHPLWRVYTRAVLPAAGIVAGDGWPEVGRFLGPSIERFANDFPPEGLTAFWRASGLEEVGVSRNSLGGGLVMWGRKVVSPSSATR